jgi:hypothetical protein
MLEKSDDGEDVSYILLDMLIFLLCSLAITALFSSKMSA